MFDGADFPSPRPGRGPTSGNGPAIIIVVVALLGLMMPISLNALVDILRYMRGQ